MEDQKFVCVVHTPEPGRIEGYGTRQNSTCIRTAPSGRTW